MLKCDILKRTGAFHIKINNLKYAKMRRKQEGMKGKTLGVTENLCRNQLFLTF